METWQKDYEQELAIHYICAITKLPCSNCAKYGCEYRRRCRSDYEYTRTH